MSSFLYVLQDTGATSGIRREIAHNLDTGATYDFTKRVSEGTDPAPYNGVQRLSEIVITGIGPGQRAAFTGQTAEVFWAQLYTHCNPRRTPEREANVANLLWAAHEMTHNDAPLADEHTVPVGRVLFNILKGYAELVRAQADYSETRRVDAQPE